MPKLLKNNYVNYVNLNLKIKTFCSKKRDIIILYNIYFYIDNLYFQIHFFFSWNASLSTFDMTSLRQKNYFYNYKLEFNRWQHLMATPVFRQPQQTLALWMIKKWALQYIWMKEEMKKWYSLNLHIKYYPYTFLSLFKQIICQT